MNEGKPARRWTRFRYHTWWWLMTPFSRISYWMGQRWETAEWQMHDEMGFHDDYE